MEIEVRVQTVHRPTGVCLFFFFNEEEMKKKHKTNNP